MSKYLVFLYLSALSSITACTQSGVNIKEGNWVGKFTDRTCFNFNVVIDILDDESYQLTISNKDVLVNEVFKSRGSERIQFDIDKHLFFDFNKREDRLTGFIKSSRFYYHTELKKVSDTKFVGNWNPFSFDNDMISDDLLLYVEDGDNGLVAYPFMGEQRTRGIWAGGFHKDGDELHFQDDNSGIKLKATFSDNSTKLGFYLVDALITELDLTHSEEDWEYKTDKTNLDQSINRPDDMGDGWKTAGLNEFGIISKHLESMIDSIHDGSLINTHSVLIAKGGALVFENYYDGFNAHIPHDMRSASKSISSAVIGMAVEDGYIKSVDEKLYDFIFEGYKHAKDGLKSKITLKDLLTMSSGLDVNDTAFEGRY